MSHNKEPQITRPFAFTFDVLLEHVAQPSKGSALAASPLRTGK